MVPEQWSRVVSASVAPVVIISASSLLCLAFYNRLAAIVGRLRAVQRERLELQDKLDRLSVADIERFSGMRHTTILESLSEQTTRIHRRAKLIRSTLLFLLATIAVLIVSSMLNGLTVVWPGLMPAAAITFVCGMWLMLCAISCAAAELFAALSPAELESAVVAELTGFSSPEHQAV
jgi:ABC-type multidrug transport system fused ATPase/permease subunit